MTIDGIKVNRRITVRRVEEACDRRLRSLDNPGFCLVCGSDCEGCEPDARGYECEACGEPAVYGAEEILMEIVL